jgi:Ca-activated chloride channel family protein
LRSYGTITIDGERTPVPVDEASMGAIARPRRGRSFRADSENELRQVYVQLRDQVGFEIKQVDISKPWLTGGTLAAMIGLGSALALGAVPAVSGVVWGYCGSSTR